MTSTPDWPDEVDLPDQQTEPDAPDGHLRDLTDDEYFDSLGKFPGATDAAGNPVTGLFDDVIDARAEKAPEGEV
jgi:hypothetical protein